VIAGAAQDAPLTAPVLANAAAEAPAEARAERSIVPGMDGEPPDR